MDKTTLNDTMAYSISVADLAITTNTEDLTCIICLNICFKPILTSCCEKLICLGCAQTMIKHSAKCPSCNEVNISFEKPSKLVYRMFENLVFYCSHKDYGCTEKLKYYFYFDHVYNECAYKKEGLAFCKVCEVEYSTNIEENGIFKGHDCEEYVKEIKSKEDDVSELERKLLELSLKQDGKSSSKSVLSSLPTGTINIPR